MVPFVPVINYYGQMTVNRDDEKVEVFIADAEASGTRLDAFLAAYMPEHVSRSRIKDEIKLGRVTVNGKTCSTPNYRLKTEDRIVLEIPDPVDAAPTPEDIPLDVLHEDEDLLVLNKPAGMVVHPAAGNWSGTMVNALLHHCGDTLSGIGGVKRPGIVHRLDKDTSGLLVVAKNEKTHRHLTAQFMDHGRTGPLERRYLALVWGQPDPYKGTIETWLSRSSTNRRKRAVVKETFPNAKSAITHYHALKNFKPEGEDLAIATLVECTLETGRTHQIRVHMSHIGHPLVGDQEYGRHFQTKLNTLPEPLKNEMSAFCRQALHAAVLGFEHPRTKEYLRFETPVPADFSKILGLFEQYSQE